LRSLIEVLGESDFTRVRVGVRGPGRDDEELADYVLSDFGEEDLRVVEQACDAAADAIEVLLEDGVTAAMNRYNGMKIVESNSADSSEG
jgi:PTH1 family peptidyl-tRNA hydrolase